MANASGSGFFTLSVVRVRPLTWKVACFGSIAERHHVRKGCKLVGCGSAVPSLEISNDDLSKIVDISDEWISARTGIRKRRVLAGRDRSLTSLAVEAAKVDPHHLDLILMIFLVLLHRLQNNLAAQQIHCRMTLQLHVVDFCWV